MEPEEGAGAEGGDLGEGANQSQRVACNYSVTYCPALCVTGRTMRIRIDSRINAVPLFLCCAADRDNGLFSPLLYRLSYLATFKALTTVNTGAEGQAGGVNGSAHYKGKQGSSQETGT